MSGQNEAAAFGEFSERILIATVGLPRSGKTFWACRQNMPIVCPDSIRLALHRQRYVQDAEPFVWAIARTMVKALFYSGHPLVILDATSITRSRRGEWRSDSWKLRFKVIDTPAEVCIARAQQENDQYIIPIIERMAEEFESLAEDEQRW